MTPQSFSAEDHRYMALALRLAERGLYTTDPNPRVGCVLTRDDRVVGEGWHRRAGEPHAEILALREAGAAARGATAYVTLEPCAHHGRTPPCADALIEAGVARVVAALEDPNPLVAGNGLRRLAGAGIGVETGLLAAGAEALNPGFLMRMRKGRPYVRCKLAQSLDGRTAMASGESRWITGPAARRDVHRWRARSSVVLTGSGTVLGDDPSLNVRDAGELAFTRPLRVVLDSRLRTPPTAKLLGLDGGALIFYARAESAKRESLRAAGAELMALPSDAGNVDLAAAMSELGSRRINEVLMEAGPTLSGAMLQAGLVDELVLYVAPRLLGDEARPLLRLPGLSRMADRVELDIVDIRRIGDDMRISARISRGG